MKPAESSRETPKNQKRKTKPEWSWGPRRRQSSEASRTPQAAEKRGHDAHGQPSDLGSERKKGLRLGVSSTKLCSQLANVQSAQESCGLGAPGPRQPGEESPRRASYAARRPRGAPALWRPHSLARPPARSLARSALRCRRPRRGCHRPLPAGHAPPLKPEPFPGRRRPLCQSAPRAGPPQLRAAPEACEPPETPARKAKGRATVLDGEMQQRPL